MITDTNVWLSRWPTRRLPLDDTPELVRTLQALHITQAWAASLDGLLHRDLRSVNRRTVTECQQHGQGVLRPVAIINPALPGWQDDLDDGLQLGIRIIRLIPGWHGWTLQSPEFRQLLQTAAPHRLLLQICLRLEDPRIQHSLLQIPDVDPTPLLEADNRPADGPVQLLNALASTPLELAGRLAVEAGVGFDIAMLEGLAGLERLTRQLPPERLQFGSFAPIFTPHAAVLKLQESELPRPLLDAIRKDNANTLLTPR